MRKITIEDIKEEKYEIKSVICDNSEKEDEADTLYNVVTTLITNKYKSQDKKKIAENIIEYSELYNCLDQLLKELEEECDLK